ncbi:MAG: DUF4340 domain-containing protein [Deltaproteobacteria bacterium]|nr:DUF4340 domain-containing protein [Deltaproteobacteria bacterium]
MKFKHTLVLLIILVVFALIVLIAERPFENKAKKVKEEAGLLFPDLQIEQVHKLQVKKNDGTITTLKARGNEWFVGDTEDYPADSQLVTEAIKTLQTIRKINLASRRTDKHELFEVKPGLGTEVILLGAEDKEHARLLIGKTAPDFFSTYIRRADADDVFLYEGYLKGHFDRPINNWRDKTIFAFDPAGVTGITIVQGDGSMVLSKDTKENWHMEKPVSRLAENSEVEKVLNTLSILKASDFADDKTEQECGLDQPQIIISATLKDGGAKTLRIGGQKDDHYYYAKSDEKEYRYLLYKTTVETLTPSVKDLEKTETQPAGTEGAASEQQESTPPQMPLSERR